jgi:hypothetical protein
MMATMDNGLWVLVVFWSLMVLMGLGGLILSKRCPACGERSAFPISKHVIKCDSCLGVSVIPKPERE